MGKVTTLDQLSEAINEILEDYGDELGEKIGEATKKIAQKGVQLLKATSPVADNTPLKGAYARGWRVSVENHRDLTHSATIYNVHPGLPHLLEYGHPTRNGGRTKAQPHIGKVEDLLYEEFNVEELI